MQATYEIHPYVDDAMGYAVLEVEGEFPYRHPVNGTELDDHTIGPRVSVTGTLTWHQGDKTITIESYGSGHFHSIDEGAALLLECFTIQPESGIGPSYWADWSPEQIAWRDEHAESVEAMASCEGEDNEGADNPCGKPHPDGCYGQSLKHLRKSDDVSR